MPQVDIYWPEDLLAKDFPTARILTYGYDSAVSHFFNGPSSQNGLSDHGRNFLSALAIARRKCRGRKIIFVAHSLGGLVLKEVCSHSPIKLIFNAHMPIFKALRRSYTAIAEHKDFRDIYYSTFAIMFFGTPHRGSDYADLGSLAKKIAIATGFDATDKILQNLKPNAEYVQMLREEFNKMLVDPEANIFLDTFQEGKGYKGMYGLNGKVRISST